jgi:hypothetical protein
MHTMKGRLIFGLLVAGLTAGCYKTECDISCADGFTTTEHDECSAQEITDLARQHGGSCRGEEKKHL